MYNTTKIRDSVANSCNKAAKLINMPILSILVLLMSDQMSKMMIAMTTIVVLDRALYPEMERADDKNVLNTHANDASPLALPNQLNRPVQYDQNAASCFGLRCVAHVYTEPAVG